jgi:hypothetical protein
MSQGEMGQGHQVVVEMKRKTGEIFVVKPFSEEGSKQFTFDLVYDWQASQGEIYEETSAPIIRNVLEGYNGTIFAYG